MPNFLPRTAPTATSPAAFGIASVAGPGSAVMSIHDEVLPVHPFTGLLAVCREQGWRPEALFPWFGSGTGLLQRCSYAQAREGILAAVHRQRSLEVAVMSGARKSIPNLGMMGLGMMSHGTRGEALRFGLGYQSVAGSMLKLV